MKGKIGQCSTCLSSETKQKIPSKLERTKGKLHISKFIKKIYTPILEKYRHHYPHVKLLSKDFVLESRKKAFENDQISIFTCQGWAEAFSVVLNHEIQSEHFGWSPKIYLESSTFRFHDPVSKEICEHYSAYFSDDAKQHASSSYENFRTQLHLLESGDFGVVKKIEHVFMIIQVDAPHNIEVLINCFSCQFSVLHLGL